MAVDGGVDVGWAWVILSACTLNFTLIGVLTYSSGVLNTTIMADLHADVSMAAWVGSTLIGVLNIMGVPASGLVRRVGCRATALLGAAIASSAFIASFFVTNVNTLIVVYGAVAGLGMGLVLNPTVTMVGHYFRRHRSLASGICCSGAALGMLVSGPLTQSLLDAYGLNGALLVHGALALNFVTTAMTFRSSPVERLEQKRRELAVFSRSVRGGNSDAGDVVSCDELLEKGVKAEKFGEDDRASDTDDVCDEILPPKEKNQREMKVVDAIYDVIDNAGLENGVSQLEQFRKHCVYKFDYFDGCHNDVTPPSIKNHHRQKTVLITSAPHSVTVNDKAAEFFQRNACTVDTEGDAINGPVRISATENTPVASMCHSHCKTAECAELDAEDRSPTHQKPDCSVADCFRKERISGSISEDSAPGITDCSTCANGIKGKAVHEPTESEQTHLLSCDGEHPRTVDSAEPASDRDGHSADSKVTDTTHSRRFLRASKTCLASSARSLRADGRLLTNRALWWYLASDFLWSLAESTTIIHLVAYAEAQGSSSDQGAVLFVGAGCASLVSRLLVGCVNKDSAIGPDLMHFTLLGIMGVLSLLFPLYAHRFETQFLFAVFYGLYIGGLSSLMTPINAKVAGVARIGPAYGLECLVAGVGILIGPPISGWIVEISGGYSMAFIFGGISYVASCLCGACLSVTLSANSAAVPPGVD